MKVRTTSTPLPETSPPGEPVPRVWARRIQVALPVALGCALCGVFVGLLIYHASGSGKTTSADIPRQPPTQHRNARTPVPPEVFPAGDPTHPRRSVRAVKTPGSKRWVIDPLPEGWDPEIARKLEELFNKIDFDPNNPDSFPAVGKALEELEAYLATLGPEALPTLASILNAEPDFVSRRRLLDAIGKLGPETEDATFVLWSFFKNRHHDPKARSEMNNTIKAMGELQNDTALELMTGMVEDEVLPDYYKDKFIIALGDHPRRTEIKALFLDMAREGGEFNLRNHSVQALKKIATPDLLPDLYALYDRERYWVGKQTILGAIADIGEPSSIPFLEEVARSAKEGGVRLSAANALRKVGTPRALGVLRDIARTEQDAHVRARMVRWAEH